MKTKEAVLALKLGCKVRRETWAPGDWVKYDPIDDITVNEDGTPHLVLEDYIPCYDDVDNWELFNDNS